MIVMLILNFILLSIGLILLYQAKKIKIQRIEQNNKIKQQINQKEKELSTLKKQAETCQLFINNSKKNLDIIHEECNRINQEKQQKQKELNDYYENLKQEIDKTYKQYQITKEEEFNKNIEQLEKSRQLVEDQLTQIQAVYEAATAARLREQEQQDKKLFYQLQISKNQISDIKKLEEWKDQLYDPTIVSKIIWSSYIIKPASDLCNRVLGSSTVCGIYKITNLITKEVYIGQSVNISDRFKQHIKCGLGIDASATNKLYNNMQEYGVWNFTFELLQKCSRDKLNEKERFWINMYQSNKVGMNITKGNK